MKAILVIDVDDVKKYHADVYRDDDKGNGYLETLYVPFKPMPEKRSVYQTVGLMTDVVNLTNVGWNACLEALEDSQNGEDSNE